MATKTIRFNEKQEKILKQLSEHFNCDPSQVIKKAISELYEDTIDQQFVEEYEKKLNNDEISFISGEQLLEEIKSKRV